MKKRKKLILFVSVIVIIILFVISIFVFLATSTNKEVEVDSLKNELINNFSTSDLREMDQTEVSDFFGFSKSEVENGVFLIKNDSSDEEETISTDETESTEMEETPKEIVVFIENTDMTEEDFEDYYILVKGYIESVATNEEDEEIRKLYENSVSSKKNNYFYYIVSKNSKKIQEVVKDYI